ncbi:hypothetical protein [Streptomyces sp. NPDC055607]
MLVVVLGLVLPGWEVAAIMASTTLVLARLVLGRRRAEGDQASARRTIPAWCVYAVIIAATTPGIAIGALGDLNSEYHVLRPVGPRGCTVVAQKTSFFFYGDGELYVTDAVGFAWRPQGSWQTDDGYRPIAAGTYGLRWNRGGGTLVVHGTEAKPVTDGRHDVGCD